MSDEASTAPVPRHLMHFPRRQWEDSGVVGIFSGPEYKLRALYAGQKASLNWTAALEARSDGQDWSKELDSVDLAVAVFDKVEQFNQYVRSRNRGPAVGTVEEWRAMIKAMIDIVLKLERRACPVDDMVDMELIHSFVLPAMDQQWREDTREYFYVAQRAVYDTKLLDRYLPTQEEIDRNDEPIWLTIDGRPTSPPHDGSSNPTGPVSDSVGDGVPPSNNGQPVSEP